MIVGIAEFDPPIEAQPESATDPHGNLSHLLLGFTYDPNKPVDMESMSTGLDELGHVIPGKPFALRVPRRPMFLRVLMMHLGMTNSYSWGRRTVTVHWIRCDTSTRLDPKPEDRAIYVGTIRCEHREGTPSQVVVRDEIDRVRPELRNLIGEMAVTPRP